MLFALFRPNSRIKSGDEPEIFPHEAAFFEFSLRPIIIQPRCCFVPRRALVAAVLFFVQLGAGLRLLWGPVSLGPLHGTLAGAIHDALPGIHLDYDQAAVEWTRDQGRVNLVVLGIRIYDTKGRVVASAPKAAIDLAAAPFLHGEFVIKRITLVGVEFSLIHTRDGRILLGNQRDVKGDDDVIARLRDVINIRVKSSQSSSLESFAVRNAKLGLFDEVTRLNLKSPRTALVLRSKRTRRYRDQFRFRCGPFRSHRASHRRFDLAARQRAHHSGARPRSRAWICAGWVTMPRCLPDSKICR